LAGPRDRKTKLPEADQPIGASMAVMALFDPALLMSTACYVAGDNRCISAPDRYQQAALGMSDLS
jgi:hypothetical protein